MTTDQPPAGATRAHLTRRLLLGAAASTVVAACTPSEAAEPQNTNNNGKKPSGPPGATKKPGTPSPTASPTPAGPPKVGTPRDVATGFTSPWGLAVLPDNSFLISERDTGQIKHVVNGQARVVTTVAGVARSSEGGLLGIMLTRNGKGLLCYFSTSDDNRIVHYDWNGTALSRPKLVFDKIPVAPNHDGGRLQLGPDGFVYVGTGDAADRPAAQDTNSLAGKVLRITEQGHPAPGNPFRNAIWSYGHRNVQGLAFDDQQRLWASEFGNSSQDELNLIEGGNNYGWPEIEGNETTLEGRVNPQQVWNTSDCSPSGLAYSRGSLWMAALRGSRLWQIPISDGKAGTPVAHFTGQFGRLRTVVAYQTGLLLTTSNTDGRGVVRAGDDRVMFVPLE